MTYNLMDYIDYPWYFEPNNILESWTITTGQGLIIDLIDSCVIFNTTPLVGKNVSNSICTEESEELRKIHGTAMAGLIVATHTKLPFKDDPSKMVLISGIAPDSFIRNDQHTLTANSLKAVTDNQKDIPTTKSGIKVLKSATDRERPQLMLINLSGGEKTTDSYKRTQWGEIISSICQNNKSILISASVGNDGIELIPESIMQYGFLPASLYPQSCKKKELDPIIRVGATNEYCISMEPKLYTGFSTGSNYGKKYVDILAPGSNIPILLPDNSTSIAGGTSESAAIISATAALMIACKPYANAQEIRGAILKNANHYSSLEPKVANGNVLNIHKIVKDFCFYSTNQQNTPQTTPQEQDNLHLDQYGSIKLLVTCIVGLIGFLQICCNRQR